MSLGMRDTAPALHLCSFLAMFRWEGETMNVRTLCVCQSGGRPRGVLSWMSTHECQFLKMQDNSTNIFSHYEYPLSYKITYILVSFMHNMKWVLLRHNRTHSLFLYFVTVFRLALCSNVEDPSGIQLSFQ